ETRRGVEQLRGAKHTIADGGVSLRVRRMRRDRDEGIRSPLTAARSSRDGNGHRVVEIVVEPNHPDGVGVRQQLHEHRSGPAQDIDARLTWNTGWGLHAPALIENQD